MLGLAIKGLIGLVLLGFGWLAGSAYPAPENWIAAFRGRTAPVMSLLDLTPDRLADLRERLSPSDFSRLSAGAALIAASAGNAIRIERTSQEDLEAFVDVAAIAPRPSGGDAAFEPTMRLCPGMRVSNAPPADESNQVQNYLSVVNVNNVSLAVNPTQGACLASGVGPRGGRMHKGLDLFSRDGGPILAGAPGIVVEQLYRDDYGNMLLIDHGSGVYTRYAHLSSFAPELSIGSHVAAGQQIGLMGNTASYPIPVHLHYEVLTGDYANPRASFGLTPRSPFEFAGAAQNASLVPVQLTREDSRRDICPGGPITSNAVITIRRGDSLAAIARACYGDEDAWRQIASCNAFLNQRNRGGVSLLNGGDLLYVGDRLTLPAPGQSCTA